MRTKKFVLPLWAFPLALLALTALTYGPLLNQLGPYWDDWVFAWTRSQLGLQGLRDLFEITRPIRGWIEAALTPLLGISALRWPSENEVASPVVPSTLSASQPLARR